MSLENAIIAGVIFERATITRGATLAADGRDERLHINHYGRKMLRFAERGRIKASDSNEDIAAALSSGVFGVVVLANRSRPADVDCRSDQKTNLATGAAAVNISAEIILGIITTLGAVLSGAVAKMWVWFTQELRECKDDRKNLHDRVEVMHNNIAEISTTVGRLEGRLSDDK